MSYNWDSLAGVDVKKGEYEDTPERKPLPPVGMHNFTIRTAEGKRGKESGLPYINLCLRVGEGQYADVYAILPLPDDARLSNAFLEQQLVAFVDNIGIARSEVGGMIRNLSSLEFKTGTVVLVKDSYRNAMTGETIEKRKPNWLKSVNAAANAQAKAMREKPAEEFIAETSKPAEVAEVENRLDGKVTDNDGIPW